MDTDKLEDLESELEEAENELYYLEEKVNAQENYIQELIKKIEALK